MNVYFNKIIIQVSSLMSWFLLGMQFMVFDFQHIHTILAMEFSTNIETDWTEHEQENLFYP